jgi:hypothetical protein
MARAATPGSVVAVVVVVVSVAASTAAVAEVVAEGLPVGVAVEAGPVLAMRQLLVQVGRGDFVELERGCMPRAREVVVVAVVGW